MKKLALLIFVLLLTNISTKSQSPCLPEGIWFQTQEQIDNFQTNYPGCTEIGGGVSISGNDITNLNGLSILTAIGGGLDIHGNYNLTCLNGLEGISSLHYLLIVANANLTSLSGLDNLSSTEGAIGIWGNNLTDLNGLENLTSVGNFFEIGTNNALTSLDGVGNLISIGGYLKIYLNNSLGSVSGIENINAGSIDSLFVSFNPLLSVCDVESICDYLAAPNGTIEIHDNAPGCNSPEEVEEACGFHCLPEGITFTTQEEIDNFQTNYPGCTEIEGSVIISDYPGNISNLNGLNVLTSIGGGLQLYMNTALTSLTGLNNLTSIGGGLVITDNLALTNLSGLENLTSLTGVLVIENNSLTSLAGIENLQANSIDALYIRWNPNLNECDVQSICSYLASPSGSVNILRNATGCANPAEIANASGFTLPCLPYGNYYFCSQSDIDNFQTNYPGCTELEGSIGIGGYGNATYDITNLDGLSALSSIGGELFIGYNHLLSSISGLNNLISAGMLGIYHNDSLANLTGLDNLTSIVGGGIDINNNNSLTSISGLANIDAGSMNYLSIEGNSSLSACDVQSICDYLAAPNGSINIIANAPGCNSPVEVQEHCLTTIEEIKTGNGITIIPNPVNDKITISSPALTGNTQLTILNVSGEKVLERKLTETETQLDISTLPRGVYFVRLQDERMVEVGKMLKE